MVSIIDIVLKVQILDAVVYSKKKNICYSNICFSLWFCLHATSFCGSFFIKNYYLCGQLPVVLFNTYSLVSTILPIHKDKIFLQ